MHTRSQQAADAGRDALALQLPEHVDPTLCKALAEAKARLRATYGDRLRRVVLYGSHARGDARPNSDIDLLVVLDGPIENSYQEIKRTADISIAGLEQYGVHLSLHHYTEAAYQAGQGPFMHNVHEEGIEL